MTARYVGVVFLAVGFFAGLLVPRGANSDISRDSGDRDEPGRLVTERRTSEPRMEGGAGVDESAPLGGLLDQAFAESSEYKGTRCLITALGRHRRETAPQFAAYFSALPFSRDRIQHWRLFFSSWGTFDGPGALAFIRKRFDQPELRRMFYVSVLKSWEQGGDGDRLAEAGDLLVATPGATGDLAKEFVSNLLARDRAKGIARMIQLSDPEAVMEMAGLQLMELAKANLGVALERLGQVQGEAKPYLTGQLLNAWSLSDPKRAAEWFAGQGHPAISPGDLNAMAANYVKVDPTAAFAWINGLPDALYSESLLQQAAAAWAKAEPAATRTWLAQQRPTAELDPVVMALVQNLAKENPASALETASTLIYDPAKSQEAFFGLAMEWKAKSPAAFASWLESTKLVNSPQKQRLLNREFHGDGAAGTSTGAAPAPASQDGRSDR